MKKFYKPISRTFPAFHPKAGQATNFVEKIWNSYPYNSIYEIEKYFDYFKNHEDYKKSILWGWRTHEAKYHTIRQGNKVKVGDFIQFYVWSGKPYRSKWILIAPPIEVKKVWDFAA